MTVDRHDGVLVVDKPVGPTSHDIVATARRALRLKRVGHTGTLDPNASGVLPLVIGRATRLAQYFTAAEKEYEATVRFGLETTTYDGTGTVVRQLGEAPTQTRLEAALNQFRGAVEQVPPAYSAKMIDGDRAYKLARRSKEVRLEAVPVFVRVLELVTFEPPHATLRIVCSAGFYVRSLAHDLGQSVETGATLEALRRTRSGDFSLRDAVSFSRVATGDRSLFEHAVPMERLLLDWPMVALTADGLKRAQHGAELRPIDWSGSHPAPDGTSRLLSPEGQLIGLAAPARTAGFLRPIAVFR